MIDISAGSTPGPAPVIAVTTGTKSSFHGIDVVTLDSAPLSTLDALTFGVVGLDAAGRTRTYNLCESQLAGLSRESVMDQEFFLTTGVCMNNFLVAQRFEDEALLYVTLDYVLTFRMRPTPVKLRLLKQPGGRLQYVLIQR